MLSATGTVEGAASRHGLWETLRALPKIELHRHLEGSLRLETLAEVGQIHGLDLPSYDIEDLRPYVQVTDEKPDYHAFLEKFRFLRRFYSNREAIERVAYEVVADAAADHVRYLELRFSPATLAHTQGFGLTQVTDWVIGAVARAEADFSLMTRLIVTLKREADPAQAEEVARVAFSRAGRGIVGLDLAGDEVNYPAGPFEGILRQARREGLGLTVHAGEATGAPTVRHAIEELGADRIGHGLRAGEDEEVVELLRRSGVTLEMCLTSNLHTAAIQHLALHPLAAFCRRGVRVTINTDDPSISSTTLSDEYLLALREIGLTAGQLRQVLEYGIEAAFVSRSEKEYLWKLFQPEFENPDGLLSADGSAAERPK
jgi:adenosine deaminase